MIQATNAFKKLQNIADELIDDRVGIIKFLGEFSREAGAPDFYHFYSEACDTTAFTDQKNFGNAGGASINPEKGMAKAIGEAVERYCSAIFEQEECPMFSAHSAPCPCVAPEEFALYSSQQYERTEFPYVPFTPLTPIRWTDTINPRTRETWYVPASMVFIPYSPQTQQGEQAIVQPISTGLACHGSWEEAANSAIAEVIERDAFTITWQAKLSRPSIRHSTLTARNRDLISRYELTRYTVTILNITMDHGIPTILSVLRNTNPEMPAMIFAASANLNPDLAIESSLEELAHTRRMASFLKSSRAPLIPSPDHENIGDQSSHVHLYCDQKNFSLAQFIFDSVQTIDFSDIPTLSTGNPKKDFPIYLEKIEAIDHQVLLKDVTTPDVEDLGLKVVRVIIPGFHPLFMGHALRALGGTRLWEVPQKMGWGGITRETGDNPRAHPYP
ncbi:MAG: YcaO-like family protein [Nitrospirae bacterium]|nr:YcaO-like family protein [Nitrospirota bacterium]